MFSTKRRRRAAWTALTLALLLLVWLFWPNRNLARVRELQAELFSDAGKALSKEDRDARFAELRTATRNLSDAQRQDLARDGMRRQEEQMARYLQMSPQEKRQYLDGQINREEEMRKRMQQQPKANRPPGALAAGGGGPGGRGGNRPPASPQEREERRKRMLDRTSPEFRAQMDVFRRDMEARRQQRGLPPTSPGFGRGGRGGRG